MAEGRAQDLATGTTSVGEARAVWRGTLAFGLVTLPVAFYPSVRRGASLRLLAPDGTPLERRLFCERDGEPLGPDDVVRGYPLGDGRHVPLEDEELAALDPERSRVVRLERFVPLEQVDPAYVVRGYVLVPEPEAVTAYRLLAVGLAEAGRAGIATFVMRGRSYLLAIVSRGGTLRGLTMRYAEEMRDPGDLGLTEPGEAAQGDVERMVAAAGRLFRDEVDPAELEDPVELRLSALVTDKLERGEDVLEPPPEADDLDEELESALADVLELLRERLGRRAGA